MLNRKGFTLIEIIAVLVLMGIVFALAGGGIVAGVRGYLLARENALLTQKAQLALSRITRELHECHDCADPNPIGSSYNFRNILGFRSINFANNQITLSGNPLVDQVVFFDMEYEEEWINITLDMRHQSENIEVSFTTSVRPRNTY